MASSPEQEIPQEIIDKAFEWTLDGGGCIGIMDIGDPYYKDLRREIIAGLLAAVLPDLQRPLLEEIERLKGELEARPPKWVNKQLQRLNRDFIQDCAQMKSERDARPDLTAEETSVLLESTRYAVPSGVSNEIVASARAKLERSLDAAG